LTQLAEFEKWLSQKWHTGFTHHYQVTGSRHWNWYRNHWNSLMWNCASIREAKDKYSWAGMGYSETQKQLDGIAKSLRSALSQRNSEDAHKTAMSVLRWGGVSSPSTCRWLDNCHQTLQLPDVITTGLIKLRAGDFQCFDGKHLLMNSAATKLFSLADDQESLIIYDSRVGAALGLLASTFCRESGINELPAELRFYWGEPRKTKHGTLRRNPSCGDYKFPKLGTGKHKNQAHAEMVVRSSELLRNVAAMTRCSIRDWEAGLFMIGYSVSH
jgi:hypothetical protein